ncbi:MAG TPA: sensor histidine kinase [Solirubrobacteraceae bacterium]|nr:sensor histidine kinase [Solirubrobacteraceae bacterium]
MRTAPFRHEALFYAGTDDFVAQAVPFIRGGVAAGEPVLVAVGADRIARLREELDGDAEHVRFADMAELGANPGRIIPAWRDFVGDDDTARPVRGIGEPIWPGRDGAELAECHRHEALLNLAFAGTPAFWLVCPYDTEALADDVLAEAQRTHPLLVEGGAQRPSEGYAGLDAIAAPFADPLPDPPHPVEEVPFGEQDLGAVRAIVAGAARDAGLPRTRAEEAVVAVHELASNSVRHGGGRGVLRAWQQDGALVCEVRDRGRIEDPLVGRRRPEPRDDGGYGVWLVNQLCDLVQVRSFADRGVVRVHVRR